MGCGGGGVGAEVILNGAEVILVVAEIILIAAGVILVVAEFLLLVTGVILITCHTRATQLLIFLLYQNVYLVDLNFRSRISFNR